MTAVKETLTPTGRLRQSDIRFPTFVDEISPRFARKPSTPLRECSCPISTAVLLKNNTAHSYFGFQHGAHILWAPSLPSSNAPVHTAKPPFTKSSTAKTSATSKS